MSQDGWRDDGSAEVFLGVALTLLNPLKISGLSKSIFDFIPIFIYIAPYMQQNLLPNQELKYIKAYTHGGMSLKKRRKTKRFLIPNAITHVVLKSSKARGNLSFYHHKTQVRLLMQQKAKKFFVEIKDFINMGNHLHIKVRFKDPKRFQQFLKSYTALLARQITGAKRGKRFGRFWDGLAYTRVLTSSIEELGLRIYFQANFRQRELSYRERELYLKRMNQFLYRLKATRAAPA